MSPNWLPITLTLRGAISLIEWRQSDVRVMFCHFWSKIMVCGNCCHTLSFKDENNRKMPVDADKNKLQNCYHGFLKFEKFWTFCDFSTFFFIFQKLSPNYKIFKKRNICTRRDCKECMCQGSRNSLHKCGFYSTLSVQNGYFSGHLGVISCISIFSFYSDFYATNDVPMSFFAF